MPFASFLRGSLVALVLLGLTVLTPLSQAADEKPDPVATREYLVAVELQDRQLYAQAGKRWQKFIETYAKDPRLPNAYHHLGVCLLQEKKFAESAATFRTILEKFPKGNSLDAAQFNLGLSLYNTGLGSKKPDDLKAAARVFAEVPAKFAKSKHVPAALYYQAECLYLAGDPAAAVPVYQKVISGFPENGIVAEVYFALGTTLQELDRDKEAAAAFQALLQKFPKDRQANEARLRLGQSLYKQKQYAEAVKLFEQTAKLAKFPSADFAFVQQGLCLYELKQYGTAAAVFEAVPAKFPKSTYHGAALLAAGKCRYQEGKLPQAQASLTAVLDKKLPEAPEAAYWLGQVLLKQNKPAEAVTVFDRAIADYPKSDLLPQLVFARVNALYELPERRKETVALFADFAAKHVGHELAPRAVYMASLAALKLQDYAASQKHAELFLADPKLGKHELVPEVLFIGAEGCLQAEKPDLAKAEALYRRLLAEHGMHSHAAQARLRVGLCLYLAKKHADSVAFLTQALAGLKEPAQLAEAHLLMGRNYLDAGKPAEAVGALQKSVQAKPDWDRGDETLLVLAQALRAQKMPAEAANQLQRLVTAYPKSPLRPQALYQLGELAYEQKKPEEAAARYRQLVSQFPKSELAPAAQHGIGVARFAGRDYKQAVQAFTQQIGNYPQSDLTPRSRYLRGLAYQRLKQFDFAVADLNAFLAAKPPEKDALEARFALALCQSGLKQFDQAAASLATLLKDKPDYGQADKVYYEMAFALLQAKKDKEAAEAFRQLAEKVPNSPLVPESWYRVGEYHENAKQMDLAAKAFAAGLTKAPAGELREKLQYKLGWVNYRQDKFTEAAAVFQALLKEHPKGSLRPDAAYLAGECLIRQDKFREALPLFNEIVQAKVKKYHARALYRTGACCAGLKDWPASQQRYADLVEQFPDFELVNEARYGLAWALQNQQKLDEARTVYEQITKAVNTETAAKSRFMIGEIAFAQKKHAEAVEHFLEAAVGYPYEEWQALGYLEAGRCFIELKQPAKAIETLETVVKKFPKHPRAKDAAQLIEDLKKKGS